MLKKLLSLLMVIGLLVGMTSLVIAETDVFDMRPWEQYDFGGETVRLMLVNMGMTPFAARGEDNWMDPSPQLAEHIKSVEDKFNVKLEFVSGIGDKPAYLEQFMSGIMAGEPSADIYTMHGGVHYTLAPEGALYPLSAIIDYDEFNKRLPASLRSQSKIMGEVYTMKFYTDPSVVGSPIVKFNKNILEAEGLPSPYDLYFADNWTWDSFEEIAYAATKDTDGDGEIDQYGVAVNGGVTRWNGRAIQNLAESNNATVAKFDENGRRVIAFDQPEFLAAIELWKQFLDDNVAPGEEGDSFGNSPLEGLAMNICNLHMGRLAPAENPHVGFVPLPRGPNADDYYMTREFSLGGGYSPHMPITVDKPEALHELSMALFKAAAPYMELSFEEWEEEAQNLWYAFATDRESIKVLDDFRKAAGSPADVTEFPPNWMLHTDLAEHYMAAIRGEKSPAVAMAEVKPAIQTMLDETLEQ